MVDGAKEKAIIIITYRIPLLSRTSVGYLSPLKGQEPARSFKDRTCGIGNQLCMVRCKCLALLYLSFDAHFIFCIVLLYAVLRRRRADLILFFSLLPLSPPPSPFAMSLHSRKMRLSSRQPPAASKYKTKPKARQGSVKGKKRFVWGSALGKAYAHINALDHCVVSIYINSI
ncbi:hypothetical protein ABB37_07452 [Leptomonas pyrrhocoris]|uniref:Uncharacterized protein n=1 Tax=Leptomonas pyrrhocoris TaxID=157538 RepID=A0A0N0VDY8_LEPPY|nr:hypothetical protein ABB37_07452 [Leptomonas pyrrhocoris]KPA76582.1 hypothetical protein ABB37_07452 [Leptomonas pyrrhocoris]|eukprot:XP_015655021.1 hypothetical protein ABB37_07452 [Leptomonas pyrrhocoris]